MQIFPSPYRYSTIRTLTSIQLLSLMMALSALSLALMWHRWGGTIEDSLAYFNTALWLRGELPFSALQAPFPYRLLIPAVASALPGELHNSFAMLNWLLVSAAGVMMALTVVRLGYARRLGYLAGVMMVLAVPTYWYAPYLVVDPGSICARAAFVLAVVSGQPWLAALSGIAATAAREENILLLVWLLAARQIGWRAGLAALVLAGAWLLAVRWWLVAGLPSYVWKPSMQHVIYTLRGDWRSLVSLVLCAGIVLPMALYGMPRAPRQLQPLKSLLILMALPPLYAALSVRIEGRVVWSLYPMLIPFAIAATVPRFLQPQPSR
ncbi:hypothetical protein GCM10027277_21570 [Pseudoduganella ginsengisoli]|uniref:Glycosyltransferase RgtA/B/C/D-like domain-containing protein n=1 Tax=Pseudoduganella ginsengisoli TaxID=1462440 RepID=A0A6L6PTI5_9BURK|nr:hypothetical protein [Pseudoduganella ginsengisoli]MTW00589.1 hypothetical protein [Pseudoduganella ginsengisoli]